MDLVYLDHNATSPLAPEVFEAMRPFLVEAYGNPSSLHQAGQRARVAIEAARAQVAALVGAEPTEIVFVSSGTEGDNMALTGRLSPGDHVVTSAIEHHAVLATCRRLEALGVAVTAVGVDSDGRVDPEAVRRALRPNTRLISVMMANNETGVLQPVEAIGRLAAEAGVTFHTDAVQSCGKVPVDLRRIGCQLLTLSAHKLGGPKGIGALCVRRGTALAPLLLGGHQERGLRAGTENVPGIVGLGAAAERARSWLATSGPASLAALRDRLEAGLLEALPRVQVNGAEPRVPNTTNLSFEGVAGSAVVVSLDQEGLCASTGAACAAGSGEPPHVLRAMGRTPRVAGAAVRLSLGRTTSAEEIDLALRQIPPVVARLRALSPLWRDGAPAP